MAGLKQKIGIVLIIFFVVLGGFLKIREHFLPKARLKVAGQILEVEMAKTPKAWQKGLAGRRRLAENSGLLFIFPASSRQPFFMKGMKFPLDIIWLEGGRVVDIAPDVPAPPTASEHLPIYLPRLPANAVLEVNAGFSRKNSLKIGDAIELLTEKR